MKQISLLLAAATPLIFLPLSGMATGPGAPPTNVPALLNTWTFENTTNWLATETGSLPMSATNVFASDLGDHYAVVVDHTNAAWLQYPVVETGGHTNLSVSRGTVCLWFAPSWASGNGPGDWGALIHAGKYTTNSSWGYWSLYCDPHGTNLYFSVQTNGAESTYLSAPISWTTNYWHFLALTYSSTNTTLYLDGVAVTNGSGLTYLPGPDVLTNGFFIGSDEQGAGQARGQIDDIFTYDAPLDEGNVAALFNIFSIIYYGNPENPANFVSAPSTISYDPVFNAITGAGYLQQVSTNSSGCLTSSNVWFTNMTASIVGTQGVTVTFSIAGGSNDLKYDVFGASGLTSPITNAPWVWLGQGNHCTTYQITNLPTSGAVLVLGKPTDSDLDGLTDAYESLIGHSDPLSPETDESGLLDWWQLAYFGHLGVDPHSDPDDDGWDNLEEYQNGTNPTSPDLPPPPKNVHVALAAGTNVTLTWLSGGGPVIQYAIVDDFGYEVDLLSSTTFSSSFSISSAPLGSPDFQTGWRVRAKFSGGAHSDSLRASVSLNSLDRIATMVRGPQGQNFLALEAIPVNLSYVLLYWPTGSGYNYTNIYASNFVNGVVALPALAEYGQGGFNYQLVDKDGRFSTAYSQSPFGYSLGDQDVTAVSAFPFVDGRRQLKENLIFLLRSASQARPFSYTANIELGNYFTSDVSASGAAADPLVWFARVGRSTNYEYSGFHIYAPSLDYSEIQELRPIYENYLWKNFVFDSSTYGLTGAGFNEECDVSAQTRTLIDPVFYYEPTVLETNPAAVLALTSSSYAYACSAHGLAADCFLSDFGIFGYGTNLILGSGIKNCFGLSISSAKVDLHAGLVTLAPGVASGVAGSSGSEFYLQTESPALQIVDYYFASQTPHFMYGWSGTSRPPMPGTPDFTPTNSSQLLVTSAGIPISVAGWAKMAITNGDAGKFAYLEQYWDKAFMVNLDGSVSTNETGLLSPYGEFFPTQAGRVALVTMPDIDTGQRGTAFVYVVKLELDVNHDGTIDRSFGGSDNTSLGSPFRFWINEDHDLPGNGVDPDRDTEVGFPDWHFDTIHSPRDLEDFARLWVAGVPPLPPGQAFDVTLAGSDQGPTIKLFSSVEEDGGIAYLTNVTTAILQAGSGIGNALSAVGAGAGYAFPDGYFSNYNRRHFLFEGVTNGSGSFELRISQNSNVLAVASVSLDLHRIKDFYERTTITNKTSGTMSNWISGVDRISQPVSSALGEAQDLIVFLHGVNVGFNDWLTEGDTVFKRLYWAGFHGQFAAVKWPCNRLTPVPKPLSPSVFNESEAKAYKTSSAFANYIGQLQGEFPGYRLHVLAHSQGNSVASESLTISNVFATYILSQAAVPASSYDVNSPTNAALLGQEHFGKFTPDLQPMGYRGGYTNITGRIVNFYNPLDKVLDSWITNQKDLKPTVYLDSSHYHYDGTNSHFVPVFGLGYLVTDSEESRAMVGRSRTLPIGQSGPESGHGTITIGVDLNSRFGFNGDSVAEHSAQWTRNLQTSLPYYFQVLISISP